MTTEPLGPGPEPDDTGPEPEDTGNPPPGPADDVLEGEVIAFPGTAAPARRRPAGGQPGEPRRIIPDHLTTWVGIRKALTWRYKRARHHVLYHLVRSPKRLALVMVWAPVGLSRIVAAQLAWWWVSEQAYLRHEAIAANDARTWHQLHQHAREVRLVRGLALLGEAVVIVLACAVLTVAAPLGLAAGAGRGGAGAGVDRPPGRQAHRVLRRRAGRVRPADDGEHHPGAGRAGHRRDEQALREYPDTAIVPIDRRSPGTAPAGWPGSTCPTA